MTLPIRRWGGGGEEKVKEQLGEAKVNGKKEG